MHPSLTLFACVAVVKPDRCRHANRVHLTQVWPVRERALQRRNVCGPRSNAPSQYSDTRVGGDGAALHSWCRPDRRVDAAVGSIHASSGCAWRPWSRRLPWCWLSRSRIWIWLGSVSLLWIRRILALLRRCRRLLCSPPARQDPLGLRDSPG